jgi:hypothetical protein
MENFGFLGALIPLWILGASLVLIVLLLNRSPRHTRRQDRSDHLPPAAHPAARPVSAL